MNSKITGFYKLSPQKRRKVLQERTNLSENEIDKLAEAGALEENEADDMVENVVSTYQLPLGIATNLKVNNKDYLVPMAEIGRAHV